MNTIILFTFLSACSNTKDKWKDYCFDSITYIESNKRDVVLCYNHAKASYVQTQQGLIFICTCPNNDEKKDLDNLNENG